MPAMNDNMTVDQNGILTKEIDCADFYHLPRQLNPSPMYPARQTSTMYVPWWDLHSIVKLFKSFSMPEERERV